MPALASAAAGFLLAVLWFDLMFDTQALRHRDRELPEPALASISAYYRRVLVDASPMGHLVALAMLTTTAALIAGLAGDDVPTATAIASLAVALPAFAIAGLHTVPTAKRLAAPNRHHRRPIRPRPLDPPRPPRLPRPHHRPARPAALRSA